MRVGNDEEAARGPRQGNAEWLAGARIVGVLGLFYRPEGRMGEPEAVAFLLADGQSVLLTCASDGSLHVGAGTWPRLPGWCVPAGQWEYAAMARLPQPPEGGWTVLRTEERRDERGEVDEAVIRCEGGRFVVTGGDTVGIRFTRGHRGAAAAT
ncbi:hypothetical protein E6R60_25795 [Streptomyces sp. A0642]|uniref:hypothetical protein n=1 Tax=Streptomyces sp. A0642 TaxID=2563100 RepID=UPI0010A287E3|nr:hypothetical protein [Streptomyces sp. A0642]THA73071.1 hypothetical protein E6R60_25795 [Streptomyces sp. A0642]